MRCAIYTRKSSAEGLDAAFTSLDNQRDYCAAYIASQAGEGWTELPARYDDGGFSGGSLKRPALTQLRADIAAGGVDVIVVHKIDRLSRSLRDFANLVAELEARGVTFVSVTQSFNTGTAMGRLTLNVLLSFAQFERELTSERLRDFFHSAAKRGRWIVGKRPFGYRVVENRLLVDQDEARIVRWIFRRYVAVKSLRRVVDDLARRGLKNREGTRFTDTIVHRMLRNRVYRGERRDIPELLHQSIVNEALWQEAAQILIDGRAGRRGRKHPSVRTCLLKGKIVDINGRRGIPAGRGPNGAYGYYIDNPYKPDGSKPGLRMRVAAVDSAVVDLIDRLLGTPRPADRSPAETQAMVDSLVERVEISRDTIRLRLTTGAVIEGAIEGHLTRPVSKRWRLVSPDGEMHDFVNLSLWLRSNAHRFAAGDLVPLQGGSSPSRAHLRLGRLRPEHTRHCRTSWKGWRWWKEPEVSPEAQQPEP